MTKFWISWYSGNYEDEGCTAPPFKFWITGSREREQFGLTDEEYAKYEMIESGRQCQLAFLDEYSRDTCTICALIDAEDENEAFSIVGQYFPDYEYRFCEESDGKLSDRFL